MTDEYLTTKEAAELIGANVVTVQGWCRDKKIKAIRAGKRWRIPKSVLLEIEESPEEPKPPEPITEDQARTIAKSVFTALMSGLPVIVQFGGR